MKLTLQTPTISYYELIIQIRTRMRDSMLNLKMVRALIPAIRVHTNINDIDKMRIFYDKETVGSAICNAHFVLLSSGEFVSEMGFKCRIIEMCSIMFGFSRTDYRNVTWIYFFLYGGLKLEMDLCDAPKIHNVTLNCTYNLSKISVPVITLHSVIHLVALLPVAFIQTYLDSSISCFCTWWYMRVWFHIHYWKNILNLVKFPFFSAESSIKHKWMIKMSDTYS